MHSVWELTRKTIQSFAEDDCPDRAAIISYYALFSIFPLILGLIAIAAFLLEETTVQAQILEAVSQVFPGSGDLVSSNIDEVVALRGSVGVVSILSLLWSGTSVFSAIRRSLNQAWGIDRERPLVEQKLLELAMIGIVGLLFVASVASTAFFNLVWQLLPPSLHLVEGFGKNALAGLLPLLFSFAIFVILYRFMPNTKVTFGDIWPGALLATVLFEAAKSLFTWYLAHFANYSLVYGTLGTVIAFLFWAYISAVVLLLGAELAVEYSQLIDSQRHRKLAQQISMPRVDSPRGANRTNERSEAR